MDRMCFVIDRALHQCELRTGRRGVDAADLGKSFGRDFAAKYDRAGVGSLAEFLAQNEAAFTVRRGRVYRSGEAPPPAAAAAPAPPFGCDSTDAGAITAQYRRALGGAAGGALGALSFHGAAERGLAALELVQERGLCDVNEPGLAGQPALVAATTRGCAASVAFLLRHGAQCNARDAEGSTAAHHAASRGDAVLLRLLRGNGANLRLQNNAGNTPIHLAATCARPEAVSAVLPGPLADLRTNADGYTPLDYAVLSECEEAVALLLRAEPGWAARRDGVGGGPAHKAAGLGMAPSLSALLEAAEAAVSADAGGFEDFVNRRDGRGRTMLIAASTFGHVDCVRVLLDKGAKDIPDSDGSTPLHFAAAGGFDDVLLLLLDGGVGSVDAWDGAGKTPLHGAAERGHAGCCALLLRRGAAAGAAAGASTLTAAHLAAAGGHAAAFGVVLAASPAQLNAAAPATGSTPLHEACAHAPLAGVEALVGHGADPNVLDNELRSPLHHAVARSQPSLVAVLLRAEGLTMSTLVTAGEALRDGGAAHEIGEMLKQRAHDMLFSAETEARAACLLEQDGWATTQGDGFAAARDQLLRTEELRGLVSRRFTYAELKLPESSLRAPKINPAIREMYLSDEEFEAVLGVKRERFKTFSQRNRDNLKVEAGLLEPPEKR
ncbi:Ankyrin repeat [Diplonema papillatum]|nr:Ankyrin repeat [Diplonema papillatum]